MKKRSSLNALLFAWLLLLPAASLFSLEAPAGTAQEQSTSLLTLLNNSEIQSQISEERLNNYRMILVELENQSPTQLINQIDSSEPSEMLKKLFQDQRNGLEQLQKDLMNLSTDNLSLKNSLESSLIQIQSLKQSLEIALDRINDAEDGALSLLDQNMELYEQNQNLINLSADIKKEIEYLNRKNKIQPLVVLGTVGLGITGVIMMGNGLSSGDIETTLIGAGIISADILIYFLGRWIFNIW